MGKVVAFIPVRGGSKSIPLKNIKEFCGEPLVSWSIKSLAAVGSIDNIVVATDSGLIEEIVNALEIDTLSIFHRSSKNASDTASTESVILEYLQSEYLDDDDIFILVQATSPLTESSHFKEGLEMLLEDKYDSIISCVRSHRFFWNPDGTPLNYDYCSRPRRQDFPGIYMENGAFYINRVGNIKKTGNRLSGKIGIYEMPEYTAMELDESDDWTIMESLMYRYVLKGSKNISSNIKLLLSDVDGVLTDSGMYYSGNGEELKKFNTRDGMAFQLLREKGILTGIVTSENTPIVERRAKKMKLDFLVQGQGFEGKLKAVEALCTSNGITLDSVAYIGDDINCKALLEKVGFAFCPSDAVCPIKEIPGITVLRNKGGAGVVREIVDNYL